MSRDGFQLAVLSDIHYAGAAEQQRPHYLFQGIENPLGRLLLKVHRRLLWLKDPFAHNGLLEQFMRQAGSPDLVVANGDYSCDSAFIGVSDDAACQSASECLESLRRKYAPHFEATIGDHELGKASLGGGLGGLRLGSLRRSRADLGLKTLWRVDTGHYVLLGVTSSLIAFPVYEPETLPEERAAWHREREAHLAEVRTVFTRLQPQQRLLLFCHDPTALPFLWREPAVRERVRQVEHTIIGHLHTPLVLWQSQLLAGLPVIRFLGTTPRRLSAALREARHWKQFKVRLCPALAGTELLKDGGFCQVDLDPEARRPARIRFQPIPR